MNILSACFGSLEGGVVLMSQVIIAGAWGVMFFNEPLTWHLILGGVLILGGGAGLSRRVKAKVLE